MSAISTKTGDKGRTQWNQERLSKDCPNFDFIGDLDELSAAIGVIRSFLPSKTEGLNERLVRVQQDLMLISSLQAFSSLMDKVKVIDTLNHRLEKLEASMVEWENNLPSQESFLILGGHRSAALTHLARAIARRCERRASAYFNNHPRAPGKSVIMAYLNRLSDYLYLLARRLNQIMKVDEIEWLHDDRDL